MKISKPEYIVPDWPMPEGISACTTMRTGGYSQGPWTAFNLADHVDDDSSAVQANRELLVASLELPAAPLWLQQVHGCDVCNADTEDRSLISDAVISSRPGVVCAVLTADCLPVLLSSKDGQHVAAIHAGWRGLAAGVIEQTVSQLPAASTSLMAWLGPAIGPMAFEVGEEVRQVFIEQQPEAHPGFTARGEKWLCDLYYLARLRLRSVGVTSIYGGGLCTYTDSQRFYSYRRDGITGRMASLIWIN